MAKTKSKFAWQDRIINHAQIGGIETSILDNGLGKGTRIAWVNTGSGLRYKVVLDRACDIADAFFNQHSLAWLSHAGVTAPRPDAHQGIEWLRAFGGGLVATCGLMHIGGPETDETESRGLHGRISNIPAEVVSIIQPDPVNGQLDMSITAVTKESRVFGPNLELKRTISSTIGDSAIRIKDVVTNRGNVPCPHMYLYHCNFGWPLVDKGADILYKGACESYGRDMDNELFNSRHNFRKACGPIDFHRATGESCGKIDVTADRNGMCTVGIYNSKLPLALQLRYKKKQLPALLNWQHFGFGDYACALEPGTNSTIGQAGARKNKELIYLKPGQSRTYELELKVLTAPAEIKKFVSLTK